MEKILSVYNLFLSHFRPQGWWPVTKEGEIAPRYHQSSSLTEKQKLEICFGAILTQNTSWKNAEKAIINLNKNSWIDVKKISKIENQKLAEIISSSGYHNQKAKKLKNFCSFLLKEHNGNIDFLFKNEIDELRKKLLSVNGIGPETADSIILYAAQKPIFVIDAYTKRIFGRLGYRQETYDELQKLFMESLPNSERLFNEYHALIVELGKNICKKRPLCGKCPLSACCGYSKKIKRGMS